MMTIEELKCGIVKALSRCYIHNLELSNGDTLKITLPRPNIFGHRITYMTTCMYPWGDVGYEVMNFIWANKVKLKWDRRQSEKTIIGCDQVGSIGGNDIICYKHQGFDVGQYFLAESSVDIDDLAKLLLQYVAAEE